MPHDLVPVHRPALREFSPSELNRQSHATKSRTRPGIDGVACGLRPPSYLERCATQLQRNRERQDAMRSIAGACSAAPDLQPSLEQAVAPADDLAVRFDAQALTHEVKGRTTASRLAPDEIRSRVKDIDQTYAAEVKDCPRLFSQWSALTRVHPAKERLCAELEAREFLMTRLLESRAWLEAQWGLAAGRGEVDRNALPRLQAPRYPVVLIGGGLHQPWVTRNPHLAAEWIQIAEAFSLWSELQVQAGELRQQARGAALGHETEKLQKSWEGFMRIRQQQDELKAIWAVDFDPPSRSR